MKQRGIILIITVLIVLLTIIARSQSVPQLINYQGRLTDSLGQPLDGETVDLTFAFYGVESGGTAYLSVLQEDVLVTGGIYHVLIGSGTITPGTENTLADVFQKHVQVWMAVKVNADPEMTPRSRISSVPYAIKAREIDMGFLDAYLAVSDYDGDGHLKLMDGGSDCNDNNASIYPGGTEVCDDGIDQDCDGSDSSLGWYQVGSDARVTYNSFGSFRPSLAWTGSEYGISWQDERDGNFEIYFIRLAPDGSTVGPPTRITNDANSSYSPSLTWTGTEFGVSWHDDRFGTEDILFCRISAAGSKIGTDTVVTFTASNSYEASLTWTGSQYGVSWYDNRDGNYEIYFVRLYLSGSKTTPFEIRITNAAGISGAPSLNWTGSEFGVSWYDNRDANWEIYFTRISSGGDTVGSDVRITHDNQASREPSMTWTGSEFGVSWYDERDGNNEIYFARASSAGAKIGVDTRITSAIDYSWNPALTWTGSQYGVSWDDRRTGVEEIYFAGISPTGSKTGSDVRITYDPESSLQTTMAWSGSEFGVSWVDRRDLNFEIYFARIGWTCP